MTEAVTREVKRRPYVISVRAGEKLRVYDASAKVDLETGGVTLYELVRSGERRLDVKKLKRGLREAVNAALIKNERLRLESVAGQIRLLEELAVDLWGKVAADCLKWDTPVTILLPEQRPIVERHGKKGQVLPRNVIPYGVASATTELPGEAWLGNVLGEIARRLMADARKWESTTVVEIDTPKLSRREDGLWQVTARFELVPS